MNYKVRFDGNSKDVAMAMQAMQAFNSIFPVPEEIGIYKMVPISEDFFYYLLSRKGIVSEEQGRKSLERFNKETASMNGSLVSCYKTFARNMLDCYEKFGACTRESWRQQHWGVSEQPRSEIVGNGILRLFCDDTFPQVMLDAICELYGVTAHVNE